MRVEYQILCITVNRTHYKWWKIKQSVKRKGKTTLEDWCLAACESKIHEMIQMANMVEKHLEGILGHWDFVHANSGSVEGFNTKVQLLMKHSYGLRDFKYPKLTITDLPSLKIKVNI